MSETFKLRIVSNKGELYSNTVSYITLFTVDGELGIGPSHTSLISMTVNTDLRVEYREDHIESFYIDKGTLIVKNGDVTILTNELITSSDIVLSDQEDLVKTHSKEYSSSTTHKDFEYHRHEILKAESKIRVVK